MPRPPARRSNRVKQLPLIILSTQVAAQPEGRARGRESAARVPGGGLPCARQLELERGGKGP